MQIKVLASVLTAALCFGVQAKAVSVTYTSGATSDVAGITSTITYDGQNTSDSAGYTSYSGTYGFDSGTSPDGTDWLSLGNGQSVTINFTTAVSYVGFLWGTPDDYNYLSLYDGSTLLGSYTGSEVGSASYANFYAGAGEEITSIVLSSDGSYFETDNLSYEIEPTVIPEPSSLLLLGTGIASLAGFVRRRRAARA
jgi:hypothetical protein